MADMVLQKNRTNKTCLVHTCVMFQLTHHKTEILTNQKHMSDTYLEQKEIQKNHNNSTISLSIKNMITDFSYKDA